MFVFAFMFKLMFAFLFLFLLTFVFAFVLVFIRALALVFLFLTYVHTACKHTCIQTSYVYNLAMGDSYSCLEAHFYST